MQSARVWSTVWRNAVARTGRRSYGGGNLKPPTMNDMPVPEGDFMALHSKRQAAYLSVLALGMASAGFGIFMYNSTNIVNFHFSPPKTYE